MTKFFFWRYGVTIFLLFFLSCISFITPLYSQISRQGLQIEVRDMLTRGEEFRSIQSDFPYPVLTRYISVTDTTGSFPVAVTNLADTSRWLGANDIALNGKPLSANWPTLQEVVKNTIYDLYQQENKPLIREAQAIPPAVTTVLVIDLSTSMLEELDEAKAGMLEFVAKMRVGAANSKNHDRAALLAFQEDSSSLLTPFTDSISSLRSLIQNATSDTADGTPLNIALLDAIQLFDTESNETVKNIIVCTDGLNTLPGRPTIRDVIEAANRNSLPVSSIYLRRRFPPKNKDIQAELDLRKIAYETGGFFKKFELNQYNSNGEELKKDFQQLYCALSDQTHHYYVMAHQAPEPCATKFVDRTLRVGVTADTLHGVGQGKYRFSSYVNQSDIRVELSTSSIELRKNELFTVALSLRNAGRDTSLTSEVSLAWPADTLLFIEGSETLTPTLHTLARLGWRIPRIAPNDSFLITFKGSVSSFLSVTDTLTVSLNADVVTACKNNANNNSDLLLVKISPDPVYDIALTKTASKDTVWQGDIFGFEISVTNAGPDTAFSVTLTDSIYGFAGLSTSFAHNIEPDSSKAEAIYWSFDILSPGETKFINYNMSTEACQKLQAPMVSIMNTAQVKAEFDINRANNQSSAVIKALEKTCPDFVDFQITQSVSNSSIEQGEPFTFNITVEKIQGQPNKALYIFDAIPENLKILAIQGVAPTNQTASDTLRWEIVPSAIVDTLSLTIEAVIPCDVDFDQFPFSAINHVWLTSADDFNDTNDNDSAEVAIASPCPTDPVDFAISKTISIAEVKQGESFRYDIRVVKLSGVPTASLEIRDALPDKIDILNVSDLWLTNNSNSDTLIWQIPANEIQDTLSLTIIAQIPCEPSIANLPKLLLNTAWIASQEDINTLNNIDTASAIVVESCMTSTLDCDFQLTQSTGTPTVAQNNKFTYNLQIKRLDGECSSAQIFDIKPEYVEITHASLTPNSALNADTLFWRLDNFTGTDTTIELTARVQCETQLPTYPYTVQNVAWLVVARDTSNTNDSAAASVNITEACAPVDFNLSIQKTGDLNKAYRGQNVHYSIQVFNEGPAISSDFEVVDTLPPGLNLSGFSPAPTTQDETTLTWSFAPLSVGDSQEITYTGSLSDSRTEPENVITNVARIEAPNDIILSNNEARFTVIWTDLRDCREFMVLDRNLYKPSSEPPLEITIEVDKVDDYRLEVYDIAGYLVSKLHDGAITSVGKSSFFWNGRVAGNKKVGSGIYIIFFKDRTGKLECLTKVLVAQ